MFKVSLFVLGLWKSVVLQNLPVQISLSIVCVVNYLCEECEVSMIVSGVRYTISSV